jgi:hypothetical protein
MTKTGLDGGGDAGMSLKPTTDQSTQVFLVSPCLLPSTS